MFALWLLSEICLPANSISQIVDDDIYISGVIPESFIIIFYFSSMCNFDDQDNHFQRTLMWRHVLKVSVKLMLTSKNKYIFYISIDSF